MAELTSTSDEGRTEGPSDAPVRSRIARRDWTTRGAVFFWIAASGAVWIALAVSAIWIY